jgi:hypothetical protein
VNIPLAGFFADAEVLDFFEYELQYGDAVKRFERTLFGSAHSPGGQQTF